MHDATGILETRVPARLDRLPWGRFHTLVVAALGITWVLDGLEVTLAGSVAGALEASPRLRFTASDIGLASSFYPRFRARPRNFFSADVDPRKPTLARYSRKGAGSGKGGR